MLIVDLSALVLRSSCGQDQKFAGAVHFYQSNDAHYINCTFKSSWFTRCYALLS